MESIIFDVILEKQSNNDANIDEFLVKSILFEGHEVLRPNPKNSYFADRGLRYESMVYKDLIPKISTLSNVPLKMLRINTNFEMKDNSLMKFPFGHLITRREEEL